MIKKEATLSVKLTKSKGVLGKDGEPFALSTVHITSDGMIIPIDYTPSNILRVLLDKRVTEIEVIDYNNVQYTLEIER